MEHARKDRYIKPVKNRKKKELFSIRSKLTYYKAFTGYLLVTEMIWKIFYPEKRIHYFLI